MNKLFSIIQRLTPDYDKLAHFYWGFIYSIISVLISTLIDFNHLIYIIPAIIAVIKEYYDYRGYGKPELWDFIFTVLPGVVIYFII